MNDLLDGFLSEFTDDLDTDDLETFDLPVTATVVEDGEPNPEGVQKAKMASDQSELRYGNAVLLRDRPDSDTVKVTVLDPREVAYRMNHGGDGEEVHGTDPVASVEDDAERLSEVREAFDKPSAGEHGEQ